MEHFRGWAAGIGAALGDFVGNMDGLVTVLITFVVVDYLTGVLCAIAEKRLSSSVGFRGICQKVMIFALVGIAHLLDEYVLNAGSMLRTAVIFFYCANEGTSILENAARTGLPVPERLMDVMKQLRNK